jgi:hypothetical protein
MSTIDLGSGNPAIAIATLPGSFSETTTSFSLIGDSASLASTFTQSRLGSQNAYSFSDTYLEFTTDVDVPYAASGTYANSNGLTFLSSLLNDITTSTKLYDSTQSNDSGPAAISLGGPSASRNFSGSLTGTLLTGHLYGWEVTAYTQTFDSDSGAQAAGTLSLLIGTVPEPSSACMLITCVLVFATFGRRSGSRNDF